MLNLLKPRSLYEEGLKVLVLDCKGYDFDQAIFGAEDKYLPRWRWGGIDITYKQNEYYATN